MFKTLLVLGAATLAVACSKSDDARPGDLSADALGGSSGDASAEPDAGGPDALSGEPDAARDAAPAFDAATLADAAPAPDAAALVDAAALIDAAPAPAPDATPAPDAAPMPDMAVALPVDAPVVAIDFEGELPGFLEGLGCALTPAEGYAPLGPEGNQFGPTLIRCLTGQALVVTLTDLPPHTSVSVDFLFAAIDSLDGAGSFPAGDYFRIDLDGVSIFREAFANAIDSQIQTYMPPVPEIVLARRVHLGFSGGGFHTDSAYDMSLDPVFDRIPHEASTLTLSFLLEGDGVQSLDDESWGIDNLRVTTHVD